MLTPRRLAKLLPVAALIALAVPASSFGQATRTWVSGVGDDANPCSRTAPCKTFAGAISKTAPKGEINVIDPGGFGGLTITKSITVKSEGPTAGVLVSGTNAIIINAGVNDKVKLDGLDIVGLGTGLNGVRILQAKAVQIRNSQISEFVRNGIDVAPANTGIHVLISGVHIHDNVGNGVLVAPPAAGGNDPRVTVRNSSIEDNFCGVSAASFGPDPAFNFATNCGTNSNASGVNVKTSVAVFNTGLADNGNGVFSRGGQSTVRIGANDIHDNFNSLLRVDSGLVVSFGDNHIDGNANNNPPSSTIARTKRAPKRAR